jgi:cardiolipin synthase
VVLSRDVMLIMGALLIHMVGGRIYPRPTWAGKAATFFQILVVLTVMLSRYYRVPLGTSVIIWLAAGFTIASGLQYLWQGVHFVNAAEREETDEAPLLR